MIEFKSDFTTPEQSKELMNAGLPAESSDLFMDFITIDGKPEIRVKKKYSPTVFTDKIIPCWSVGRLQEIAKICAKEKEYYYASVDTVAHQEDFVEWWVKHFTLTDNVLFDLSKLE